MGWRVVYLLLPLFCLTMSYASASSSPTLSDISNYSKHCQISRVHKTIIKRRNYIDMKHQEATPLKSSRRRSIRVKRDLMKLNLFDLPRALVWLLNRLNRGRRRLLKEMIPSHLPASYSRQISVKNLHFASRIFATTAKRMGGEEVTAIPELPTSSEIRLFF